MMKPRKVDQIETMKHNIIPGNLWDHRSKRNDLFCVCGGKWIKRVLVNVHSLCLVRLMSVITELCFTGDAVKREACSEKTNVGEKIK